MVCCLNFRENLFLLLLKKCDEHSWCAGIKEFIGKIFAKIVETLWLWHPAIDGKQGVYPAWNIVAQRVNITIKLTHTHIISLPGISDKTRIFLSLFFHLKIQKFGFVGSNKIVYKSN